MIKHPYNPLPISRIRSDAKRRNRRNSLRRCRRHFPGLLLENNREGANESTVSAGDYRSVSFATNSL